MSKDQINLLKFFSLAGPLILAPLAGGPCTPDLVAAVCNAGGLGSIGAAYLNANAIEETTKKVRTLTDRPFAINLFAPYQEFKISKLELDKANLTLAPFRRELGLPTPDLQPPYHENFSEQLEMVLRLKPAGFSFVFGVLDKEVLRELKARNIFTMGGATALSEAQVLEESGVDAIVLQGAEAGGHRAILDATADDPHIRTLDLVRQCAPLIRTPLIAAGGLMTGPDIRQALQVGAQAAQLGTAFLLCPEAGTSPPYRERLLNAKNSSTKLTRAFSGRLARGIENKFMREMQTQLTLPFPAQNQLTRDLRNASVKINSSDYLSLWAGSGVEKIRALGAAELVKTLFAELNQD